MAKYHLNQKGEPALCKAQEGNCPLGGEHFDSTEAARQSYEADMEDFCKNVVSAIVGGKEVGPEPFQPKYPNVTVPLIGQDGNAYAIIGRTRQALGRAGMDQGVIQEFTQEATSGDYDHVLQTVMRWVNVPDEGSLDLDEDTPEAVIEHYASKGDVDMRTQVAVSPATSPEQLDVLSHDESESVRACVVMNRNVAKATFDRLKADPHYKVREAAVVSVWTRHSDLVAFSNDRSDEVRAMAAKRINSESELNRLATDPSSFVRSAAAVNLTISEAQLLKLAKDPELPVKRAVARATRNQDHLSILAKAGEEDVDSVIIRNPTCSDTVKKNLAKNGSERIRKQLLEDRNTSVEVLKVMAKRSDEKPPMRRQAFDNMLQRLAVDNDLKHLSPETLMDIFDLDRLNKRIEAEERYYPRW